MSQSENENLSVRIVIADYYLHKPIPELGDVCYSGFRSLPIYHVPVIRIFGPTTEGIKTCVHVHGIFPYIFVPNWNNEIQEKDLYHFAAALDKAINVSFAHSNSKSSHVYKITQVSGRPFYGYHESEKKFLKIEFYNPVMVKRAADLLLNGAIFNTKFQPHEAHVPYILQFFIDNNLYGMNNITFSSCRIRKDNQCDKSILEESMVFSDTTVPKQTYSKLEVDVTISELCTVLTSGKNMPKNPGLAFIWEEEIKRRKLQDKPSQITPNQSQQRPESIATSWDTFFGNKLLEKLKSVKECPQDSLTFDSERSVSSSQEMNSQSKSILQLLENLAEQQRNNRGSAPRSRSSSPSLVYSDEEDGANISALSSQPVLKFNAEADSILGNNFSDDENDLDEHDHKALSQSMIYTRHEHLSSEESELETLNAIPQLDGSHDIDSRSKKKRLSKSKIAKDQKNTIKPSKANVKKQPEERSYNLRSRSKDHLLTTFEFQPMEFKIVLDRLDLKTSPKKPYPKLKIDTQKSPKMVHFEPTECESKSENANTEFCSPSTSRSSFFKNDGEASESVKKDQRFPQLEVSIRKSPKSPLEKLPRIEKLRARLKKRKIIFEEEPDTEQRRKSLKKKRSDTCFKIGDSFSLAQFKVKKPEKEKLSLDSKLKALEKSKEMSSSDIDSQMYTLSVVESNDKTCDKISYNSTVEKPESNIFNLSSLDPDDELLLNVPLSVISSKYDKDTERTKTLPNSWIDSATGSFLDGSNIKLNVDKPCSELDSKNSISENLADHQIIKTIPIKETDIKAESVKSQNTHDGDSFILKDKGSTTQDKCIDLFSLTSKNSPQFSFSDDDSFMLMLDDETINEESSRKEDDMESLRISNHENETEMSQIPEKDDYFVTVLIPEQNEVELFNNTEITEFHPSQDLDNILTLPSSPSKSVKLDLDPDVRTLPSTLDSSDYITSPERAFPKKISKSARNLMSQKPSKIGLSPDLENRPSSPSILDESHQTPEPVSPSILDKYKKPKNLIDNQSEDTFNLQISPDTTPKPSRVQKSSLNLALLNNSIWDGHSDDEDQIQSFYDDVECTASNFTQIRDDSSPMAKPLTSQSAENEILSFYESQSPEGSICSIRDLEEFSQKSGDSKECTQPKRSTRIKSQTPPNMLHSTPQTRSKKSPSPTYTPILKKLVLKKYKEKRKISSQRFQTEPFLPEIKEEEEKKKEENDKNTSFSLPIEFDKMKSLNASHSSLCSGASYQIEEATLDNTYGFKMKLENLQNVKTDKQYQYTTLVSMELFIKTRGDLNPDPEYDSITALFFSIFHDAPNFPKVISGLIVVKDEKPLTLDIRKFKCEKKVVDSEVELFDKFLSIIRKWDPDMFVGYEVEMLSWGFFIQRGYFLGKNYCQELSRVSETRHSEMEAKPITDEDEYSNELKLPGRIVLNVWRLMRHEVSLQSYTFENILFHVTHQRVPYYTFKFLTDCWNNEFKRYTVFDYFLLRVESNIILLDQLDFIGRTSELARLFGIQFYEVLSRGSQFRVESMMLRLAKTQNYVAVSPSVKQRAAMRAPESLPLIMEPESKFYTDPVIVLDFQSLYPSIIIAYNYCFSTCLGRVNDLGENQSFHFGCIEHMIPNDLLVRIESSLNFSPAGVAFVNKSIRKGILPAMLEEILETRLMVKSSLKQNKDNSILKRVLHARQLGLKLIANVTYGYTSANFSGRMPCIEIGDSVVSKGRETLERAIEMVKNTEKWGARVVYGDTDSLFVLVPNRTKEEAFKIGTEIAEAVTNANPKPVKLKLEKVYLPSILQTKKRYVGYMYENVDQEKPVYDAKGIETVRRDGCPAISKILEKSLKLLFETRNVNTVKQYVQRQFSKLVSGRISIQELTFAREYRGMSNYKPAACVPALQLAKQALLKDRRAEPRIKERVRYVITAGPPGVPLIRLVKTPKDFLETPGSLINTDYYITRAIIPAMDRCFTLLKVNIFSWYTELPRKQRLNLPIDYDVKNKSMKKKTISHYFSSSKCLSCSKVAGCSICRQCEHKPQRVALILGNMINNWQRKYNSVATICRSCSGGRDFKCSSLDCPIFYLYHQSAQEMEQVKYAEELKQKYLYF